MEVERLRGSNRRWLVLCYRNMGGGQFGLIDHKRFTTISKALGSNAHQLFYSPFNAVEHVVVLGRRSHSYTPASTITVYSIQEVKDEAREL